MGPTLGGRGGWGSLLGTSPVRGPPRVKREESVENCPVSRSIVGKFPNNNKFFGGYSQNFLRGGYSFYGDIIPIFVNCIHLRVGLVEPSDATSSFCSNVRAIGVGSGLVTHLKSFHEVNLKVCQRSVVPTKVRTTLI